MSKNSIVGSYVNDSGVIVNVYKSAKPRKCELKINSGNPFKEKFSRRQNLVNEIAELSKLVKQS